MINKWDVLDVSGIINDILFTTNETPRIPSTVDSFLQSLQTLISTSENSSEQLLINNLYSEDSQYEFPE